MSEVGITQVSMDPSAQQPGAVPGPGAASGTGPGTDNGGSGTATVINLPLFDHEKLEVYQVAREFLVLATGFDRASSSIPFNIGEGAGKTATQLDVLHIRGFTTSSKRLERSSFESPRC